VVALLNFMIIEIMSKFIVSKLVNIALRDGCDNLSAPKRLEELL